MDNQENSIHTTNKLLGDCSIALRPAKPAVSMYNPLNSIHTTDKLLVDCTIALRPAKPAVSGKLCITR